MRHWRAGILTGLAFAGVFVAIVVVILKQSPLESRAVRERPDLIGLSPAETAAVLGAHAAEDRWSPADRTLDELRVSVFNTHPPGDPASASVIVLERLWTNGAWQTWVWFHDVEGEWVSFEAVTADTTRARF